MLLWCVHDFPAYAMLAGTSNKGYYACPVCGPNTPARHSQHLSKVVYGGSHRRWLPPEHPFRYDTNVFRTQELEEAPERMDAKKHIRWAFLHAEYAWFGGRLVAHGDPMLCSSVKRLPSLFTLPYWKVKIGNFKCSHPYFRPFLHVVHGRAKQQLCSRWRNWQRAFTLLGAGGSIGGPARHAWREKKNRNWQVGEHGALWERSVVSGYVQYMAA